MRWYLRVLRQYAVFGGRASRKEYWMFMVINLMIWVLLPFITGMISNLLGHGPNSTYVPGIIYSFALITPSIAVGIRRLHDTNRSGWWVLPVLIPAAFLVFLFISQPQGWWIIFGLVPFVLAIALFIFLVQDSQPGDNRYGPSPKLRTDDLQ
jgi:uncharacterized membrane protein YhaH (DUF805 family)